MHTQAAITMNRSRSSWVRIGAGIAATAMTAVTIGVLVLLPARIEARNGVDPVTAMKRDTALPSAGPPAAANQHKRARG